MVDQREYANTARNVAGIVPRYREWFLDWRLGITQTGPEEGQVVALKWESNLD
jgi:hypothetical protein